MKAFGVGGMPGRVPGADGRVGHQQDDIGTLEGMIKDLWVCIVNFANGGPTVLNPLGSIVRGVDCQD